MLTAQALLVTYGQRFRELRLRLWAGPKKTVLGLAERLDSKYPATIYNIEKQWRVPTLPTIQRHARALGCEPWELLSGVETEYDLARRLASRHPADASREWQALLKRYKESAKRVRKKPARSTRSSFESPANEMSAT